MFVSAEASQGVYKSELEKFSGADQMSNLNFVYN